MCDLVVSFKDFLVEISLELEIVWAGIHNHGCIIRSGAELQVDGLKAQ